ncbi:MAG: tetratricopeptide repeat protein [Methylococcales bacterium]
MIKVGFILFFLLLTACGGSSVSKPSRILNAESYSQEAIQAYQNEDWPNAQDLFNRALSVYQGMDNRQAILGCHINLVEVALALGNIPVAYQHLTLADKIVSIDKLVIYRSRITLLNALILLQDKQVVKAESLLQPLLSVSGHKEQWVSKDIRLAAIATQTEIAFKQKKDEAFWLLRFEHALKKSVTQQQQGLVSRLLRFQAKLLLQQGNYTESEDKLQQALTWYKNHWLRSGIAGTLLELGALYQQQGNNPLAIDYFKRSIAVFYSLGNTKKVKKITKMLTILKHDNRPE